MEWRAPANHSRRDWIGIYLVSRLGGQTGGGGEGEGEGDRLVTKISSQGKWVGVVEDEWVGDVHHGNPIPDTSSSNTNATSGVSVFSGNKLPYAPGIYEMRYHHDGKHNILARSNPIEIYVNRLPLSPSALSEAEELARTSDIIREIVRYSMPSSPPTRLSISSPPPQIKSLDKQAGLVEDAVSLDETEPLVEANLSKAGQNADDFTIWDRTQATKISKAIKWAFDIELSPEVIIAEANISRLALDLVEGRRVLQPNFQPLMS